ncbi:MAG TPA: histidine phosphatase family protein [Candidatus Didemnitutus sp.]|jgi:probable phosphoglycerate mutase
MVTRIHLLRHGETDWAVAGRHTGRTEVPLNARGEEQAARWLGRLETARLSAVFTSPRLRARRTCELAGCSAAAQVDPDLAEWDYGDYEGLRTPEIHARRPDWNLFTDGCPGGETPEQVAARADRLIVRLLACDGEVALFTHGHFGRVLAARWMRLPVAAGSRLEFGPAGRGILAFEHGEADAPVLALWNELPPS